MPIDKKNIRYKVIGSWYIKLEDWQIQDVFDENMLDGSLTGIPERDVLRDFMSDLLYVLHGC